MTLPHLPGQQQYHLDAGPPPIKFGVDFRWLRTQTALGFIGADNYGHFDFTGAFSKNQFADFLCGFPLTSYANVQLDNDGRARQYHAYVQDSFRVSGKLTFEYGVRWDYQPPFADQAGNIGNFDRSIPLTGAVLYPSTPEAANSLARFRTLRECLSRDTQSPCSRPGFLAFPARRSRPRRRPVGRKA